MSFFNDLQIENIEAELLKLRERIEELEKKLDESERETPGLSEL